MSSSKKKSKLRPGEALLEGLKNLDHDGISPHIPSNWKVDENKTSVHGDGSTTVKSPLVDATGADIGNTVTRLGDLSLSRDSSTGSNVSGISGVSVSCASSNGGDAGVDGTEGKEFEKMASEKDYSYDVRVAVVGNVDSGKSTLIGVLTLGDLDDGRGGARSKVVVHRHEAESGRTSCVSQHIMGFNEEKEAVHQSVLASASSAAKTKGWSEVVSKSKSLITFIDLAGHEKYLKTTIAGLTGCFPDYAVVLVNSLAGVTKMTREHLGVVIALKIPLSVVVTKIDLCPQNVLKRTKKQLFRILRSKAAKKIPIIVKGQEDIQTALDDPIHRVTPVFWVSSVTGKNIDSLTSYLSQLMPRTNYDAVRNKPIEFRVEETFNVTGVGTVISGTVASGTMRPNITLNLGPHGDGSYKQVYVRSIHRKRVPVDYCPPGDSCAISVRPVKRKENLVRAAVRKGMVMIEKQLYHQATRWFEAEVLILHHPTTIKLHYQAVIHAGVVRQTASIDRINAECLRTGDKASVRFKFMIRPEYIHAGTIFIFREGNTKGIGRITRVLTDEQAIAEDEEAEKREKEAAEIKDSGSAGAGGNASSPGGAGKAITANHTIEISVGAK